MHQLKALQKGHWPLAQLFTHRAWAVSVRKMARPREVSFLLALFVLLGTLHGTRAQYYQELVRAEYEDYDDYGFDEDDYDNEEYVDEDADAEPEDSNG